MVPPPSNSTSDPVLRAGRAGQLIAGAGATLALLGPVADWLAGIGVFTLILGVIVAAPVASNPGPYLDNWWPTIAVAGLICLIGFGLGFVVGWLGGLLLVGGGVTVLVTLFLGSPPKPID
ncbi:MAG: hypothetical protein M9938_07000 [Solirubrobacterales bacterium]|nr:hypothetical protein [Solirubrobacterales bacterium]